LDVVLVGREVFIAMEIRVAVFWAVTPCSEDGGSMVLRNFTGLPHHCKVSAVKDHDMYIIHCLKL